MSSANASSPTIAPAAPLALGGEISLVRYAFILMQLGLLAIVLRQFQVESSALLRLSLLGFAGFAIHYFLPLRLRLPFFVVLSLAGLALVMGVANAAWIVAFGTVLIAICHLPLPFAGRVALLLIVGALLAALRLEWISGPWSRAIWPILGAMFMFRLIV